MYQEDQPKKEVTMKSRLFVTVIVLMAGLCLISSQSAIAKDKYVIKLATSPPYVQGSPQPEMTMNFKKLCEKYSNGKLEVQVFWGGQLGTEQKVVKDAQMGIIQMFSVNVANLSPFASPLYSLCLPAVFDNRAHAFEVLYNKGMTDFLNQETIKRAGLRLVAPFDCDYRSLFNTQQKVEKPEDMKGLKWRVPNNPVFIEMYKAWGVEPIPMAWAEVFSSLQTKVIHGGDNILRDIIDFKFYEVAPHATYSQHILQFTVKAINEAYFQKLPKDLQDVVVKAGREAWKIEYEAMNKDGDAVRAELKAKGVTLQEPDPKPFLEPARTIWPKFVEKCGGQAVFDKIMSYR
jgi:tripartite ATP-independent transporter DctP family solute receptor